MSGQTIVIERGGPGMVVRALWFLFIGWYAAAIVIGLAWLGLITVIGIPLFAYLINRVPQVLTLARRPVTWSSTTEGGVTTLHEVHATQRPVWQRALYLVVVGWWFSAIWMTVAWLLCVVIVGLPIGIWMFNRTPLVATLHRW